MQHNEPGFGAAFEQLHRTPDDHERVASAFARATGGSLDWADAGAQLAQNPENAAEILGFTAEADDAHRDDPEGLAKFRFYQREIGDAMTAYVRSDGANVNALYHAADHLNDALVHHKHAPVLGLASSAAHMTDEELAAHQTGIEAAAFATPEMVGVKVFGVRIGKKKKEGTAAGSSSDGAAVASGEPKEKKKGFFSRTWGATRRFAGSVAATGKKALRKTKEAIKGQVAKLKDLPEDATIRIYKNSRGNSANQVFLNPGQIRRLYSVQEDDEDYANFQRLVGKINPWRLPPEAWEGIPEAISIFEMELDIEEIGENPTTLLEIKDSGEQVGNFLAFGSARSLAYPFAQLYLWEFGVQGRKFTWNSQKAIKINALFKQNVANASPTRYDFSAKTKPAGSFDFLGRSTSTKFVGDAMDDFEADLDQFDAGGASSAYVLWKDGELFVIDLAPKAWRSAALAPRLRLYCTHVVPDKYWQTRVLQVTVKFVSLQLAVESQGVGAAALNAYAERKRQQSEAGASSGAAPGAASAADVARR